MKLVKVLLLVGAIVIVFKIFVGVTRVNPGYVGIRVHLSGVQRGVEDFPLMTGWIFYIPIIQQVFEYPTFMQTAIWTASKHEGSPIDESITFNDRDQVPVNADMNLSYSLDARKVPAFYVQFRSDNIENFTHGYLRNVARDAFNAVGSRYSFDEINGLKKEDFLRKVQERINEDVSKYGVTISQFGFIGALRPPQNIAEAINSKIQAIQKAIQAENELRQAKAEAAKVIAIAEGTAQANERIAASISAQLIEWERLQITKEAVARWDGRRPMVEGNASGLLLNISPDSR